MGQSLPHFLDVKDDKFSDPAVRILAVLGDALSRKYSLEITNQRAVVTNTTKLRDLVAEAPGADLVLNVRTSAWGFAPTRLDHYGLTYDGTLTLIDARSSAVVAEGVCSFRTADSDDAPTYAELCADNGAIVRDRLVGVTDNCLDDYKGRVLGIYP